MTEGPITCTPQSSVREVARLMRNHDVGAVPIVRDLKSHAVVGVVTDRDLALRVVAEGLDRDQTPVHRVMSRDVVCCGPLESHERLLQVMPDRQIRRVPIVDGNGGQFSTPHFAGARS